MTVDWNHTQYLHSWRKKPPKKTKEYFREQTGTEVEPCCVQNWLCACKLKHNQWKHKVVDFLSRHSHLGFGFNIFTIKLFCCLKTNALLLWNHDLVKHVHGEYHTPSKGRKIFFFYWRVFLFIYLFLQCPKLMSKTQSSYNTFLINCLFEGV